jgi:hypothetical protein
MMKQARLLTSLLIILATVFSLSGIAEAASWHSFSGCAFNIWGADGSYPWQTGCNSSNPFEILYWDGSTWKDTNGAAQALTGSALGGGQWNYPYMVGTNSHPYFGDPGGSDIDSDACHNDGVTWTENANIDAHIMSSSYYTPDYVVSNTVKGGGFAFYYDDSSGNWHEMTGDGLDISVAPDGGTLFMEGQAFGIQQWTGSATDPGSGGSWTQILDPGKPSCTLCGAVQVAAAPAGGTYSVYIVDSNSPAHVWGYNGSSWTDISGSTADFEYGGCICDGSSCNCSNQWLSSAVDGSVFAIDETQGIWHYY